MGELLCLQEPDVEFLNLREDKLRVRRAKITNTSAKSMDVVDSLAVPRTQDLSLIRQSSSCTILLNSSLLSQVRRQTLLTQHHWILMAISKRRQTTVASRSKAKAGIARNRQICYYPDIQGLQESCRSSSDSLPTCCGCTGISPTHCKPLSGNRFDSRAQRTLRRALLEGSRGHQACLRSQRVRIFVEMPLVVQYTFNRPREESSSAAQIHERFSNGIRPVADFQLSGNTTSTRIGTSDLNARFGAYPDRVLVFTSKSKYPWPSNSGLWMSREMDSVALRQSNLSLK